VSDPGTSHTELRYGDGTFSKENGLALADKEFLGVTQEDLFLFDSSVYMLRLGYRANSLQTKHRDASQHFGGRGTGGPEKTKFQPVAHAMIKAM